MINTFCQDLLENRSCFDSSGWNVIETAFDCNKLHHQETVFTLGNGYLGTRGTFEEGYPGDFAATLINGVYDDVAIGKTELVNVPSWLSLVIKIAGESFRLDTGTVIKYERKLDMRLGLVSRDIRWRAPCGHTIDLHFERFASLADHHIMAVRVSITSVDFAGDISIETYFDDADNQGVQHWEVLNKHSQNNYISLHSRTKHSNIQLGMATKLVVEDEEVNYIETCSQHCLTKTFAFSPGQSIHVEKIVTIFTSRETEDPLTSACDWLKSAPNYSTLFAAHIAAWEKVWEDSDILIDGDDQAQISVRFNIFQLLAAAPYRDNTVSIPPKTLSGFAYRGHIFWDTEIFAMPFFTFTQPQVARNLLEYRYHTLPGARRKAQETGYRGAMYAWESADTGDETTPRWVPSPTGGQIRIWCGDIEVHINTDVAYAIWQYWKATGDDDWMVNYGASIILETALFWESRIEWNEARCGYDILDVIGPDENHDRVNNNAFTNVMVRWHLRAALHLWEWLQQKSKETSLYIGEKLKLNDVRLDRWTEIEYRLYVNHDAETGLIEQFEGFFDLEDVDLEDYEPRTKSMQALLGIEATNQKQILKQPDVLMLLYLLRNIGRHESPNLHCDQKTLQANWNYYNSRTDHAYGSSLGPAIHAILACDMNQIEEAYTHFLRASLVDLEDTRKNAAEGIHAASAGGVWQAVVFGFAGTRITPFGPIACPNLPPSWKRLKFKLQWQNHCYEFDLSSKDVHQEKYDSVLKLAA
jgi:trehalose/maltose hydrolase-like predicted phosphorylase